MQIETQNVGSANLASLLGKRIATGTNQSLLDMLLSPLFCGTLITLQWSID